ncbi:hypothetical protein [Microbacterium sp. cf046]|uniref:hypothetical protein n=1 Tax=Microbacterium sp. cf046 TaxID=1761803 RepID=UPI001113D6AD|nr:hypothetical protein [Microbacterium sp. cf046]
MANALAVTGFATVDLRTVKTTPFVPLDIALNAARTTYNALSVPAWDLIATHLMSLKTLGVSTVAVRSDNTTLRIVLCRPSPDGNLDISEAVSFLHTIDQWSGRFSQLLPQFQLSAEREKLFEAASSWVGRYTGQDSVKWAASKLMYMFARAAGAGSCIVMNPVGSASQDYLSRWQEADLQKEHVITGSMHTASYLWVVNGDRVVPGNGPTVSWNYEPDPQKLQQVLTNSIDT